MSMIPVFLINLDGSEMRLNAASAQLAGQDIPFQRVPAFDGRNLRIDQFPDYDHDRAVSYMGRPLRGGEIGCYLSHLEVARRFLAGDAPLALVLEDDMQLAPGFAAGLAALLDWLAAHPLPWDLVHLAPNRHRIFTPLHRFEVAGQDHLLTHAHYFPMTTTALIWSRPGAQAFVDGHRSIWAPVDNHFRHWQVRADRGLAVWPPLVTTSGAESEIDDGKGKRSTAGRHPFYGLIKQRRLLTDKLIAFRHKLRAARK